MVKRIVRNAFVRVSSPHPVDSSLPSRVKQEFLKEVNINSIMAKARQGIAPRFNSRVPMYGDFTNSPRTFQDAFEIVQRAEESFNALPLGFRREIDNDPRNLATAPKELYAKYGLLKEAASPASEASRGSLDSPEGSSRRGVKGDDNLPHTGRSGPDMAASKKPPVQSDED